eukprot:TRINITY_DN3325_c0_g3_i1.p1 TRINITY_DN3325_c0_g3~~TRINITY_DN3325_c0_g3_i1.p1  ORF type:complete len:101 (+),score=24.73 TRINITY_DN3325_c0_g3_i1:3-305(+)
MCIRDSQNTTQNKQCKQINCFCNGASQIKTSPKKKKTPPQNPPSQYQKKKNKLWPLKPPLAQNKTASTLVLQIKNSPFRQNSPTKKPKKNTSTKTPFRLK